MHTRNFTTKGENACINNFNITESLSQLQALDELDKFCFSSLPKDCIMLSSDVHEQPIVRNGKLVVSVDMSAKVYRVMTITPEHKRLSFDIEPDNFIYFLQNCKSKFCLIVEAGTGSSAFACMVRACGHDAYLIDPRATSICRGTKCKDDAADAAAIRRAAALGIDPCVIKDGDFRTLQYFLNEVEAHRDDLQRATQRIMSEAHNELVTIDKHAKTYMSPIEHEYVVSTILQTLTDRADRSPELMMVYRNKMLDETDSYFKMVLSCDSKTRMLTHLLTKYPLFAKLMKLPCVGPDLAANLLITTTGIPGVRNAKAFLSKFGTCPAHTGTGGKTRVLGLKPKGSGRFLKPALRESVVSFINSHKPDKKTKKEDMSDVEAYIYDLCERMPFAKVLWRIAARVMTVVYFTLKDPDFVYNPEICKLGAIQKSGLQKLTRQRSSMRFRMRSIIKVMKQRISDAAEGKSPYGLTLEQAYARLPDLKKEFVRTAMITDSPDLIDKFDELFALIKAKREAQIYC